MRTAAVSLRSSALLYRAPAPKAALANGVAGHAMDYDDTQLSTSKEAVYGLLTHPTTPVLAAVLAIGETEKISGEEFVLAYILGVEVECRIADAINPRHYQSGFHSTATMGGLGAAMAVGKILRLKEEQLMTHIGIAASMASGLRENFGTMTKPLHAGRAARKRRQRRAAWRATALPRRPTFSKRAGVSSMPWPAVTMRAKSAGAWARLTS